MPRPKHLPSADPPERRICRIWNAIHWAAFSLGAMMLSMNAAVAIDGKELAATGNGNGAHPCAACHGDQGEGRPDAAYPRLAGLDAGYLLRQLNDFADGNRASETMHPIAKALAPDERKAAASFYAGLIAPMAPQPRKPSDEMIAKGKVVATRGDWANGLPACAQCHGPIGQGVGASFPKLAGQSAEYIVKELTAWKEGKRTNDPLNLMTGIAAKLDEQEVEAVAAYYSSIPAQSVGQGSGQSK